MYDGVSNERAKYDGMVNDLVAKVAYISDHRFDVICVEQSVGARVASLHLRLNGSGFMSKGSHQLR
jgi:hypothetical protein